MIDINPRCAHLPSIADMSSPLAATEPATSWRTRRSGAVRSRRSLYARLRGARTWFVPVALFASALFMLQSALCWPWTVQGARPGAAVPQQVLERGAAFGPAEAADDLFVVAHSPADSGHRQCCETRDAATAQAAPTRSPAALAATLVGPGSVLTPVPDLASREYPRARRPLDGSRARSSPYHARTARLLI